MFSDIFRGIDMEHWAKMGYNFRPSPKLTRTNGIGITTFSFGALQLKELDWQVLQQLKELGWQVGPPAILCSNFIDICRVMRTFHFLAYHDPFGGNMNLFRKTINMIFMYLLAHFIDKNLKNFFEADPELRGCIIFWAQNNQITQKKKNHWYNLMYFLTCFIVQNCKKLVKANPVMMIHYFGWPCQIDFLFHVTRAHAKKLGALNLFVKKLARQSFFFIIGEKKNTFHMFQFWKLTKRHQRISFKQRVSVIIKWSMNLRYLSLILFIFFLNKQ